eukprot:PhM_4_TR10328/c0_g1_i1/m.20043
MSTSPILTVVVPFDDDIDNNNNNNNNNNNYNHHSNSGSSRHSYLQHHQEDLASPMLAMLNTSVRTATPTTTTTKQHHQPPKASPSKERLAMFHAQSEEYQRQQHNAAMAHDRADRKRRVLREQRLLEVHIAKRADDNRRERAKERCRCHDERLQRVQRPLAGSLVYGTDFSRPACTTMPRAMTQWCEDERREKRSELCALRSRSTRVARRHLEHPRSVTLKDMYKNNGYNECEDDVFD